MVNQRKELHYADNTPTRQNMQIQLKITTDAANYGSSIFITINQLEQVLYFRLLANTGTQQRTSCQIRTSVCPFCRACIWLRSKWKRKTALYVIPLSRANEVFKSNQTDSAVSTEQPVHIWRNLVVLSAVPRQLGRGRIHHLFLHY